MLPAPSVCVHVLVQRFSAFTPTPTYTLSLWEEDHPKKEIRLSGKTKRTVNGWVGDGTKVWTEFLWACNLQGYLTLIKSSLKPEPLSLDGEQFTSRASVTHRCVQDSYSSCTQ